MITLKNTHLTSSEGWVLSMNVLLSALMLGGCNINPVIIDDPIATLADTVKTEKTKDYDKIYKKDYNSKLFIAVGDTIVKYKEPKLHTAPAKDPDLAKIKNDKDAILKGKPLRMIVVGGSLSAGVRDGGYFNEGILTSYPNLIARQMKLKKFEQPLFDKTQYNGVGRRVKTSYNPTGGPIQKFNTIQNNLAAEYTGKDDDYYGLQTFRLPEYKGEVDNFALPKHTRRYISGKNINNVFKNRFLNKKDANGFEVGVMEHLKTQKFDFFILETGIDDTFNFAIDHEGDVWSSPISYQAKDYTFDENISFENYQYVQPELKLIRESFLPIEAKGVMLNIPDVLDFPYFLKKEYVLNYDPLVKKILAEKYNSDWFYCFKPSSAIDSLLSPKVHISIKPVFDPKRQLKTSDCIINSTSDYRLSSIQISTKRLNDQLINFNKKYGYPIVDIRSLYQKILSKTGYTTEEGLLINASNFFSTDGLNPTPIGQAVIGNEVIKTINQHYKTEIPLIRVSEYLQK